MGTVTIIFEGVSLLAAKAIEWIRPGTGYVETSTRYIDMKEAERFIISALPECIGENGQAVEQYQLRCFALYAHLLGEKLDGPFPAFLRQQYSPLFTRLGRKDLEIGIGGESYDVLGCLLPASTLTSLACHTSGEALPQLLKHLLLENTPEFTGLVKLIIQELTKVGGEQFVRHFEPTPYEQHNWKALAISSFQEIEKCSDEDIAKCRFVAEEELLVAFQFKEGFENVQNLRELAIVLSDAGRGHHDKLPSEFECYTHTAQGVMSFRGWRDLQRQQYATHNRTRLTPDLGFYAYDKPAPPELAAAWGCLVPVLRVEHTRKIR